jgi:hypothetical protein
MGQELTTTSCRIIPFLNSPIAYIRGIAQITQTESDRQRDEEEKERDHDLQNTIAILGFGIGAAQIGVSIGENLISWEALRVAYEVSYRSQDEWLTWAEDLSLFSDYGNQWYPPLGSRFKGEHRWVRDELRQALSTSVVFSGTGKCFGPNYGMWLGNHVFTPDILMRGSDRLAENTCHDCYMEGAADLVIEIVLPEQKEVDEQIRWRYYEQGNVLHYWAVNPVSKQIQFWRWLEQEQPHISKRLQFYWLSD